MHKVFDIPSRRDQAALRLQWIDERVEHAPPFARGPTTPAKVGSRLIAPSPCTKVNGILPGLMDESAVEFWLVSQKVMPPGHPNSRYQPSCFVCAGVLTLGVRVAQGIRRGHLLARAHPGHPAGRPPAQRDRHEEDAGGRRAAVLHHPRTALPPVLLESGAYCVVTGLSEPSWVLVEADTTLRYDGPNHLGLCLSQHLRGVLGRDLGRGGGLLERRQRRRHCRQPQQGLRSP